MCLFFFSVLVSYSKKGSTKERSNYQTIELTFYARNVMFKILQARPQQYMNWKLRAIQVGFRKGRGTRDQIVSIFWIIERSRKFQKNIICCFTDYIEPLAVWIIANWKTLKEMGIPDHLACLLRTLYVGQEATVRTLYETTDWFKIEKGVWQGCLSSPCLFNLYAEHIMRNAKLEVINWNQNCWEKYQQPQICRW